MKVENSYSYYKDYCALHEYSLTETNNKQAFLSPSTICRRL